MMIRSLWITLCLVVSLPVLGNENLLTERYNLTYLDLGNGLPHNNVSDIFEDSNGFLWISTFGGGLVRYDGYGVMEPRLDLNSKSCRNITEDNFHRLWVAFDEGINIIDLRTMNAVVPDHPDLKKLLVQPSIRCYRDAIGRIWIINNQQVSLVKFKEDGEIDKICAYPHNWRMLDMAISDIEGNGKPWVGIDSCLYRLVERDGKLIRQEISPLLKPLQDYYITDILKRNNVVWITTNMGLFRYDPYRQKLDAYHHSDVPGTLSHVFLSSLAVTPDNHLLVGSLAGVNIYDDQTDSFTVWNRRATLRYKVISYIVSAFIMAISGYVLNQAVLPVWLHVGCCCVTPFTQWIPGRCHPTPSMRCMQSPMVGFGLEQWKEDLTSGKRALPTSSILPPQIPACRITVCLHLLLIIMADSG